jgi:hypothetical protein
MNPPRLLSAAAAIAITFGTFGYFIGKKTSAPADISSRPAAAATPHQRLSRPTANAIDPQKFRATLESEPNTLKRFKLALQHLEEWLNKDPMGALNWLASQPPSERRNEIIGLALQQFARSNAKGAADWAEKNLTGTELNNTLITIAERWAHENGREAAAYFLTRPDTEERNAAAEQIFFTWAANEPALALATLESQSAWQDLSPTLRRAALAGWVKTEPEAATTASLTQSHAANDPDLFANTLANWATIDLDSSSEWLLQKVQPGVERSTAAEELAIIFAHQSPEDGISWLQKLNAGPERDAAASALASAWARSGTAQAAQWAASQNTANLSENAIVEIGHNYLMKDPAAFEAWRASLPAGPVKNALMHVTPPETPEE